MHKLNLSKIKSCNQNWDAMESCASGRLCGKCQHVIRDFRGKTEWEIALLHAGSEQMVCGIYDPEQLRDQAPKPKRAGGKRLAMAGVLGILAGSPLLGQEKVRTIEAEKVVSERAYWERKSQAVQAEKATQTDIAAPSGYVIRGTIRDEAGESLPGAIVVLKGTKTGTIADAEGRYVLEIPDSLHQPGLSLIYQYIGYARKEQKVSFIHPDREREMEVQMEMSADIIAFGVARAPLHKRAWYRLRGLFHRKNR